MASRTYAQDLLQKIVLSERTKERCKLRRTLGTEVSKAMSIQFLLEVYLLENGI